MGVGGRVVISEIASFRIDVASDVAASGPGWTHKAIRHISGAGDVAVGSEWAGDGVDTRQGAVLGQITTIASDSFCRIHVCARSAIGGVDRAGGTVVSNWAIRALQITLGPWCASVGACIAILRCGCGVLAELARRARQTGADAGPTRGGPVGARQAGLGGSRSLRTVVASSAVDADGRVGRAPIGVVGACRARRGHRRGLWAVFSAPAPQARVQRDHVGLVVVCASGAGDGGDCVGRAVGAPRAIPRSYRQIILIRIHRHVAGQGALELGLIQVGADAFDDDVHGNVGGLALGQFS